MTTFSRAAAALARRDPVMATLIERSAPFNLPGRAPRHFAALAESILYQQLAGAAAAAIHRRFLDLFDGDLSPETMLALPERTLRALPDGGCVVLLESRHRTAIERAERAVATAAAPAGTRRHPDTGVVGSLPPRVP